MGEVLGLGNGHDSGFKSRAGAMDKPGQPPANGDGSERYVMNSCTCVAIFPMNAATMGARAIR